MLGELILWWAEQMRGLLPSRWRAASSHAANALVLNALDESRIEIILRRRHRERSLGPLPPDATRPQLLPLRHSAPLVLRLPAKALLERDVTLPPAAERHVANILRCEMDRLTPFTADAVFWEAHIIDRNRADGRITVRLAMILRSSLQPLLDRLAKLGLRPSLAEIGGTSGTPWRIMLDHPLPGAERQRRRKLAALAGMCVVLALTAVLLPFVRQSVMLGQCNARIAALRPRTDEAAMLRRRIAADPAGSDAVAAESAQFANPLQAIAMLTEMVPDGSFLSTLSLRRQQLAFTGESEDAARLIGALAADPRFVNPTFAGPVNRSTDDQRDRFSIHTELRRLP